MFKKWLTNPNLALTINTFFISLQRQFVKLRIRMSTADARLEEQTTVRDCQNTGLVDSRTTELLTIGTQLTACNQPVRLSQKHSQSRDDVGRRTRNWWVRSTRHYSLALRDELCVYLGRCGDRLLGTTMLLWWATMDSLVNNNGRLYWRLFEQGCKNITLLVVSIVE